MKKIVKNKKYFFFQKVGKIKNDDFYNNTIHQL